ncbi:MAG: circularly permuted type 2 ATP-grasp protein, partial [Pseudomonadales bacterium]
MSDISTVSSASQYRPSDRGYDEAHDGQQLRPHWQALFANLASDASDSAAIARLAATVARLRAEHTMSTAHSGDERPWQLDPLPLVLDNEDWAQLERGIIQRCELLSRIVQDFYGPARVLSSGLLPPALAFANPGYLLPACGMTFDRGPLSLVAFDLGRAPDGTWWVLNNRTDAPTGLGYVLENRIVMARSLPEAIEQQNIERLASFYRHYGDGLQRVNSTELGNEALAVILSGGPLTEHFPEQAYLGRYLGLPVVEGNDLTVRNGAVKLKTLEGLKSVRSISRALSSELCDPMELRGDSLYGTAGLLDSTRQGNVAVENAIGSGVVENDAIMGFLPGLCEALLDESLTLPSVATWWCGQPEARQYVLENLERLTLRSAFESKRLLRSSVTDYLAGDFGAEQYEDLADALRTQPYRFVGKETMQLSHVPYYDPDSGLQSAPMTLRLYAARTADGFAVLPGGLARVATPSGDISKDVWAPKHRGRSFPKVQQEANVTRRSDKDLPSRTADDLFWLGRYLERTEGAIRLYRTLFRSISGNDSISDEAVTLEQITELLVTLGLLSEQKGQQALAEGLSGVDRELWNLLFDPDGSDGLANILANVKRTANRVRGRQSTDTWRIFESLHQVPNLRWRTHSSADVIALLN